MKKIFKTALLITALGLPSLSIAQNFNNIHIDLNNGDKYTNSTAISVKVRKPKDTKITKMIYSDNEAFQDAHWVSFNKISVWDLENIEGAKRIYAKFKDTQGNESEVFSTEITLDKTPPKQPNIEIDAENNYTNFEDMKVDLIFECKDAKYMIVSNSSTFFGEKWRAFQDEVNSWKLQGTEDGEKAVYVKFRDAAGNETQAVSATVIVDRFAPTGGKLIIDGYAKYCTDGKRKVMVNNTVNGDPKFAKYSEDNSFSGVQWEEYSKSHPYILSMGEGNKTIYAKFKDIADNESKTYSASIILDISAPTEESVVINNGDKVCKHPDNIVSIAVSAKDATMMRISNNHDFLGEKWKGYKTVINNWRLTSGAGMKTIYAQFRDEAGNVTKISMANILVEEPPKKK